MKYHLLPVLFLLAAVAPGRAQTTDADTGAETPAPGSTVIESDELHMDQTTHVAVFTGNVVVTGTNFTMKCEEMTVNFDKTNKIDNIVAKGDVVIVQPGRVTRSGQAIYYHDEDKFDLTDQPVIRDNGKTIAAPEIIIYRTKQYLFTKGRSTIVIPEGSGLTGTPAADKGSQ
jgi:lipopolysaccharide transport protein LptA